MSERVTIVDYRAGNLSSVCLAVEKLGRRALITDEPAEVRVAPRLVFPGVGAASTAMETLRASGLGEAILEYARTGRPMLGICLGAQIILQRSEEGEVACLGLVEGEVERLRVPERVKVPHMGWNAVRIARDHPLWHGVEDGSQFYFVHSYAPAPADPEAAIGRTDYHGDFVSALAAENIAACQFHPERSGRIGLRLLENFLSWHP